jgi:hypothetical protein
MQDDPKHSRFRIKTAEGHQILLDDTNERIYISTCVGRTWIELDKDGHVNIFGADSISMRSGKDINMYADGSIHMEADKGVHIKANKEDVRVMSGADIHILSNKSIYATACSDLHLAAEAKLNISSIADLNIKSSANYVASSDGGFDMKGGGTMKLTSPTLNLNGAAAKTAKTADCATNPTAPNIVPGHEPWTRPPSAIERGKGWSK